MKIVVYLDSNDYSRLSDTRLRDNSLGLVRAELLALSDRPDVQFVFSGAHISELAPLERKSIAAADARADVLVALCRRNSLISFDRLIKLELSFFSGTQLNQIDVLSEQGEWFPEIEKTFFPVDWRSAAKEINDLSRSNGANRAERRALNRKLFHAGRPKPNLKEWIAERDVKDSVDELLRQYPMRQEDAETISKYVLGQATAKQAQSAFEENLRDPRWMIKWFFMQGDRMTPFTEWVRAPSKNLAKRFAEIGRHSKELRAYLAKTGHKSVVDVLTSQGWATAQNQLLLNIGNELLRQLFPTSREIRNAQDIDLNCPGLSMAVRSLHSALWDTIREEHPRKPANSDFVDAIHAMYTPYVSVIRTDRYMMPHVIKQRGASATKVVNRLEDIPETVQSLLRHSEANKQYYRGHSQ